MPLNKSSLMSHCLNQIKAKKMKLNEALMNPRVIVVQKLYAQELNKESELTFPKHRYKKFIKDVVLGTLERKELIQETIQQHLSKDLSKKRTDKLLIVLLQAAIFEVLYRPQTSLNIIINEYLNTSDFFLEQSQKIYLNAILDKISKKIRS